MIFVNTKRCSPVAYKMDLPNEGDLFHFRSTDIPMTLKERNIFFKDNNIFTDKEWWNKQVMRCIYGYDIPNAIEKGGDAIIDGVDCIWDNDDHCYLPQYDLLIKNRTIHITGRHYFYLNFWPILSTMGEEEIKNLNNPLFTDYDFLFARRIAMMYEQRKDNQEAKARQLGVSEKLAGMIIGYNFTFQKNSINVIVAGISYQNVYLLHIVVAFKCFNIVS